MHLHEPSKLAVPTPGVPGGVNWLNVLLVLSIGAAGALSLWCEGYVSRIDWPFALYVAAMCILAVWVAAVAISTRRFLRLIVIAGAGGYVTQYVGAALGAIWSYPPPDRTFYYVPAAFVMASLVAYGSIVKVFAPRLRRLLPGLPRSANLLVALALIGMVVVASLPYRGGQGAVFWLYYGAMFVAALYFAVRMDMATLLALVMSAVIVGSCSESLGAHSGLWTFDNDPGWLPPVWLIFGSWPLEIMMHFSLSATRPNSIPSMSVAPREGSMRRWRGPHPDPALFEEPGLRLKHKEMR